MFPALVEKSLSIFFLFLSAFPGFQDLPEFYPLGASPLHLFVSLSHVLFFLPLTQFSHGSFVVYSY